MNFEDFSLKTEWLHVRVLKKTNLAFLCIQHPLVFVVFCCRTTVYLLSVRYDKLLIRARTCLWIVSTIWSTRGEKWVTLLKKISSLARATYVLQNKTAQYR